MHLPSTPRFALVVAVCTAVVLPAEASDGSVFALDEALFTLHESDRPPETAQYQPVKLPDLWSKQRPNAGGSGWYRFSIPKPNGSDKRWAVYLPKLNMNGAVFVNGTWIGDGGSFERPVAQNWNRPLFFTFSADLLNRSQNTIDVRIFAYEHDWGTLGPIKVGPEALLRKKYERQFAFQISAAQLASLWALMVVLFVAALWAGRSQDPVYPYFVLASTAYLIHSLSAHVQNIIVPYEFGRWLVHVALDWFSVLLAIASHCWIGERKPRLERAFLAFAVTSSVICAVVPSRYFLRTASAFHLFDLAVAAYAFWLASRHYRSLRSSEAGVVAIGTIATVAITGHAVLIQVGVLPQDSPRLLMLLAPVLVVGFGGILVARFIRASKEAEELNRVLEQRVREKEAELKENFERLRVLERKQVLTTERERLMQEMHDGMGAQLVSTLSLAEMGGKSQQPIARAIRESLDDLRLVIDSLDPGLDDIVLLIGTIRSRLEPRLSARGLQFHWAVEPVPNPEHLMPHHFLHILRIVQEAITNAIKHADATTIGVHTSVVNGDVVIEVRDNGVGFQTTTGGRGLNNMQRRATELAGRLEFSSKGKGTAVVLSIPLKLATEAKQQTTSI